MAWCAPLFCGFTPGDRARAGTAWTLARLRPRPLGPYAGAGHRPADRRNADRRDAVLRPQAISGRALHALSGPTASARQALLVAADSADHAVFRPCVVYGQLVLLTDHLVVLCQRLHGRARHHVHDHKAVRLELT